MSTRRSRSRDNSNSEAAGRLANWQIPTESFVPFSPGDGESSDVGTSKAGGEGSNEDLASSLDRVSFKDDRKAFRSVSSILTAICALILLRLIDSGVWGLYISRLCLFAFWLTCSSHLICLCTFVLV